MGKFNHKAGAVSHTLETCGKFCDASLLGVALVLRETGAALAGM